MSWMLHRDPTPLRPHQQDWPMTASTRWREARPWNPMPIQSTTDHESSDCPHQSADDPEIRWDLVTRMRELLHAGQLDTPERWCMAEAMLLQERESTDAE